MAQLYYKRQPEDTKIFKELRKSVYQKLQQLPKSRITTMRLKAIVLPFVYFGFYFCALFATSLKEYFVFQLLMGIVLVLLYLNVIHEAAHHNIFKQPWANSLVLYCFDLVGANSYIWKNRHLQSHHNYPNVEGWDTDIEQSGPVKIYPHGAPKWWHKKQHWFVFLLYPLYLFNWLLVRDFKDFFGKNRIIRKTLPQIPKIEFFKLVFFKLFYLVYQIIVPIMFFGFTWKIAIFGWIIQIASASILALFFLLPVHALEVNSFPLPAANNSLDNSWATHQMATTNDISQNNWFVKHFLGNYNYHVLHHLFPSISYVYYHETTQVLENFALQKGLPYKKIPIQMALKKHFDLLKNNAQHRTTFWEE